MTCELPMSLHDTYCFISHHFEISALMITNCCGHSGIYQGCSLPHYLCSCCLPCLVCYTCICSHTHTLTFTYLYPAGICLGITFSKKASLAPKTVRCLPLCPANPLTSHHSSIYHYTIVSVSVNHTRLGSP